MESGIKNRQKMSYLGSNFHSYDCFIDPLYRSNLACNRIVKFSINSASLITVVIVSIDQFNLVCLDQLLLVYSFFKFSSSDRLKRVLFRYGCLI